LRLKNRRGKIFREGLLRFKTGKLLEELQKKGYSKISYLELQRRLGLPIHKRPPDGWTLRRRRIIRKKILDCGWKIERVGNCLFCFPPNCQKGSG